MPSHVGTDIAALSYPVAKLIFCKFWTFCGSYSQNALGHQNQPVDTATDS
jgi:hypothetical protein